MNFLYNAIVSGVVFGVLDSIWFSTFMKKFAVSEIGPILRLSGGKLSVNMPAAIVAYLLMILIACLFLVPRLSVNSSMLYNFSIGALMGMCVFGIFDFTNHALLNSYTIKFVIFDVLWGSFMYGCLALILVKMPFNN